MKLRDRIKAFFGHQKASASVLFGFETLYSNPFKYETYAQEGFRQNCIVYACIKYITGAAKKIDIVLYRGDELVESDDRAAANILALLEWPNPNMSMRDFVEVWNQQMNIAGMTFLQQVNIKIDRAGEGVDQIERIRSGSLWLLPPQDMTIISKGRLVEKYVMSGQADFTPEEVTHMQFPDPLEPFEGLPPMRPGSRAIDTHNRIFEWNDQLLQNHGIPPLLIGVKGISQMEEADIKKLLDDWASKYGGSQNAGKPAFFPGEGFDFVKMGLDPSEMDWTSGEGLLARRICNVFEVPSPLLGDPDTSKYSNYKEARKALYSDKVLPDMESLVSGLNRWLMPMFGGEYHLELDISDIEVLREDENQRVDRLVKKTWLTINEKRKDEGLEPVDGGNTLYIPFNLVPLGSEPATIDEENSKAKPLIPKAGSGSLYPTEGKRVAAWWRFEKLRRQWEATYQKQVEKFFAEEEKRVLDVLNNYRGTMSDEEIETKLEADQLHLFDEAEEAALYAEAMTPISKTLMISFGDEALKELGLDTIFEVERPAVNQWLAENLAQNGKNISQSTANQIRDVLQQGMDRGEGVDKLAERITDKFSDFSQARARTIARTEAGAASGKAKLEGYKDGNVQGKEWLTARDGSVRDTHAEAEGQIVPMEEPFYVGGFATDTAPAQTGVASEDINCRCTFAPVKNISE